MEILQFLRRSASEYSCPSCRTSLSGCGIDLLRFEDDMCTVEVTCATCKVVFVVVLRVDADNDEQPPRATGARSVIDGDEVLAVHEALANLSGPITTLFNEPTEG